MDEKESEAFRLTMPVTQAYQENILPYEMVVESINLQDQELYELEKQYIAMKKQVEELPKPTEAEEELLVTRTKQRIIEKKMFAEEALIANEKAYQDQYEKTRVQLEEEISLLQTQIQIQGAGRINIFLNLNENLLGQLLEQHRRNQEHLATIKLWRDTYERSKRKDA